MARYSAGTLKLSVDEKGLYFEFEVPNTTIGNDLYENIRLGNISQCSFKFIVEEDEWKYALDDSEQLDERTITKISQVLDVSPVVYPAYEETSLEARSFQELEQKKQEFLNHKKENNVKAECESRDRICQLLALGSKF
jgi:HK97 family phage prohead protease